MSAIFPTRIDIRRMSALVATAALILAGPAFATVKSIPIRVRLAGTSGAAEPNKPFEAVLEIAARADAEIEELFIHTGQTWTIVGEPLPQRVHLAAGETRSLPFSVVSPDPTEPFFIEYQWNGEHVRKPVDVTPAAVAARQPMALARVDDPAVTAALAAQSDASALRPEPSAVAGQRDRRQPGLEAQSVDPPRATSDYNVRVVGYFHYRRMNDGAPVGVDGAVARVYDEDSSWDELLATQVLGPDGRLDVTFNWDPCFGCDGTPDLYVEFELDNAEVEVQEGGILEVDYTWETGVWNDFGGTYLDIGNQTPSNAAEIPACHVMVNAMRAWRFAANTGRDTPKVDIQWPETDPCGACYNAFWEEIYLDNTVVWNENTITHEFGHHFVNSFATYVTPNYCVSGFCDVDPPDDCGHCEWCRETTEDAFSEGFPSYFGNAVLRANAQPTVTPMRNYESVANCGGAMGSPHDPWQTEGWFAALLNDIDDAAQDDDPGTVGARDELNLGFDEILWIVDFHAPTTPAAFITRFNEEYPQFKEQMWATSSNNGYQYDVQPPGKVTNITSDHLLNGTSTNPIIKWSWDRAPDDASGIAGYSIWVQQGILPGMPDATQDVNDVTEFTSGPHPPGNYYISIRARDRNGTWSNTYETQGPYGIRAADPANLVVKIHSNWDYLGVTARHTPDASAFDASAPVILNGSGGWSYLSAIYNNSGEQPTNSNTGQFWTSIFLDGYPIAFQHRITPLNPFEYEYILNKPVVIPGGRHVLRVQCDASELLAEPNEFDNYWARQWAWDSPQFAFGPPVFYYSPPRMYEDTQWIVDGSAYYPNCRSFRMIDGSGAYPNNMWTAVALHATDAADYDLSAYGMNDSPTNALATPVSGSYRGANATDIVLMNSWSNFLYPWGLDFGVTNYSGGSPGVNGFHLQKVTSSSLGYPGSSGGVLAANEMLKLYQFDTSGGALFAKVTVQDPSQGRVYLTVVHATECPFRAALTGIGTLAVSDLTTGEATVTGNYAADHMVLAVWRDPTMGTGPLVFNVSVQPHPPDMAVATPPGWAAPLVPRPANDGTPGAVPAPAFLVGDAAQTYLNYAMANGSPIGVPPNPVLTAFFFRDGLWFSSDNPPPPGGNVTTYRNLASPITVKGGRHVLGLHIDATDAIPEMSASNNFTAGQWVWRPAAIPFDAAQAIAQPPDRFGGWNLLPAGTPLWFNMDGIRSGASTPDGFGNGYKVAFATIPDIGADVDLKLYEAAPDAVTGFDVELASSAWGIDQVDYVLADFRATAPRAFDAGFPAPAVQAGTGLVESRLSKNLGAGPASPAAVAPASREFSTTPASISGLGPFTIGAGHLFDAYEIELPVGNYDVRLVPVSGGDPTESVDWGIALHAPGATFQSRSDAMPGGMSWAAPPGDIELMEVTVPTAGWHTVVVWKNRRADVDIAGAFTLEFNLQTSSVPEAPAPPARRLIAAVRPNPFTADTRVDIRLEASADVELQVFDLGGRRVFDHRVGHLDSGDHALTWDGRDQEGRPTPTGIYFIRVLADGTSDRRKVVKVQ